MTLLPLRLSLARPTDDQRKATDPQASAWVTASAGTGKTKVLTDRVLSLMLAGTPPQKILCLTFTKAAAAEMANRISARLGEWTMMTDDGLDEQLRALMGGLADSAVPKEVRARARCLFAEVLDTPGGLNIQTLHAFCQSLLGRFPLEAGIAPHFQVMDERDASEMLETAKEEVLARVRSAGDDALVRALADVTRHVHETAFSDLMGKLANARGDLRALVAHYGSVEGAVTAIYRKLGLADGETPEDVILSACADNAFDGTELKSVCAILLNGTATDIARGQAIADWLAGSQPERAMAFETYRTAFLTAQGIPRKTLITKKPAAAMPTASEILAAEANRLGVIATLWRAAVTATATAGMLCLGHALVDAYDHHKAQLALLDFDDLILTARDMLRKKGINAWVLFKLDGGIDHVLIDEAQDTNPLQWDVIEALTVEFFAGQGPARAERTVFAVGDVKQSIFSFQKADPAAFPAVRNRYAAHIAALEKELRQVSLTLSFRSTRAVLQAVDKVFSSPEAADGVALEGETIKHEASRKLDGGLVELWPAVEPRPTDSPPPWKPPVERTPGDQPATRLAKLIANRIHRMIAKKETLESAGRAIRAGDIMVLVRRRTGFVVDLVRELKRLKVPVAGVDRMVLTDQMAVMDLIALGRFLLQPEDDLTLATILKGPLIGFDEETLFGLAHGRSGSLWDALRSRREEEAAFDAAERTLADLLAQADFTPPFEFYSRLLGAGRGREKLLARLGPDADDPISVFLDLALTYERSHVASLEGFLHWVESGDVEIKRDLEQSERDAVRVMTAHGAKGLQAPIVFLPDTLGAPTQGPSFLWPPDPDDEHRLFLWPPAKAYYDPTAEDERSRIDLKRDQEYRRLLYVAMTRAEDRLYVCGWHTKNAAPAGCWYNLIKAGLTAAGAETVDEPFLRGEFGGDAKVLRLTCPQVVAPDTQVDAVSSWMAAPLPGWAKSEAPAEPAPARPLAPSRLEGDEPVALSPFAEGNTERFLRGRLVHRLLQSLPDLPADRQAAAARSHLARPAHGLSVEAQEAIAVETLALLGDPRCRAVFGPGSLAEVPLVGEVGGKVLSARLDRLVVTEKAVMVIDYKTNRPPPSRESDVSPLYLRQMAAYRAGLREIYSGKPIQCLLLWTDGPRLMPLSDDLLDTYAP